MQSSLSNLMTQERAPGANAVAAAIDADLKSLAQKHVSTPSGAWPGSHEGVARDKLREAVMINLFKTLYTEDEWPVFDNLMKCAKSKADGFPDWEGVDMDLIDSAEVYASEFATGALQANEPDAHSDDTAYDDAQGDALL